MNEPEDIDALAGEYVLGTLDPDERARVAARRAHDAQLDAAIAFWEQRLRALDDMGPEAEPPPGMFTRITAKIDASEKADDHAAFAASDVISLVKSKNRWRVATFATGALAAVLAFVVVSPAIRWGAQPANFVAVLQRDSASPAFVVDVDLTRKVLTVRRVAADQPAGKSYELWMIHDRLGAPKSLGVVADQGFTVRPVLANYDPSVIESATYAVTLEPAGGSPTGAPTSAPLWTGKLLQATP